MAALLRPRPFMPTGSAVAAAALLGLTLSACSSGPGGTKVSTSDATGQEPAMPAPTPDPWAGTEVISEEASVELLVGDGRTVALWIDPQDPSRVLTQRSEPEDPGMWNEPTTVATAGDVCLALSANTDGERIGATLQCYESNGAIDQAPDQSYALVSTDSGATWRRHPYSELTALPVFTRDEIVWDRSLTWSEGEGFVDQS